MLTKVKELAVIVLIVFCIFWNTTSSSDNNFFYEMINFEEGDISFSRDIKIEGDFSDEEYINSVIDNQYRIFSNELREKNIEPRCIKYAEISCETHEKCTINMIVSTFSSESEKSEVKK